MASKNAQCSSTSEFWILKISRKIGVLKQSESALFCSVTDVTILFVFTCMMNVTDQTIQAFVTGSGPFRASGAWSTHTAPAISSLVSWSASPSPNHWETKATTPRSTSPFPSTFPIQFAGLLHFVHQWRPNQSDASAATSPINVGTSAISLSHVTLFEIKKNIMVLACCGHSPLCSTFSKNPTTSPLDSFCQLQGHLSVEAACRCLVKISTPFPDRTFLALARLPPIASNLHFSKTYFHVLQAFVTLPMLCPFFHLCLAAVHRPGIRFLLLQRSALLLSMPRAWWSCAPAQHYHPHF